MTSGKVMRGLSDPTASPAKSTPATPNRNPKTLTSPSRNPTPITTKRVRIEDSLNAPTSEAVMSTGRPSRANPRRPDALVLESELPVPGDLHFHGSLLSPPLHGPTSRGTRRPVRLFQRSCRLRRRVSRGISRPRPGRQPRCVWRCTGPEQPARACAPPRRHPIGLSPIAPA